jgi:hypothetical protein
MPRPDPLEELSCRELLSIIDEEVESLPVKQRLPILLCCFEGLSLEEAAASLGWKPGAVKGHLQRGRSRLHARLVRRGLTLSAGLAAVEASRAPASSALIAGLAATASRGALVRATSQATPAEGISPGATDLARAVLRTMALSRLAIAVGLLLPVFLVALGLAVSGTEQPVSNDRFDSETVQLSASTALVAVNPAELVDDDDIPIKVSGRVLDPAGKPFAGANLYVGYAVSGVLLDRNDVLPRPQSPLPLRAKSGADGQFEFSFTRSELDGRILDRSKPAVIAVASGYGPEWSSIAGSGHSETLTLKLVADRPLNGRILDSQGKPVVGAKIRVLNIDSDTEKNVTRLMSRASNIFDDSRRRWRGAFPERPQIVTSDANGRFQLTALGRDRIAMLAQDEPGNRSGWFFAVARPSDAPGNVLHRGATFEMVAIDTRPVRGVCRDAETAKPVAGVRISVRDSSSTARLTTADGRFEIPVPAGEYGRKNPSVIVAEPPNNLPYFLASALVPQKRGSEPITMDFNLVRGIPVSGKVQSPPGRKPPKTGLVEYYPLQGNTHAAKIETTSHLPASSCLIQPDGSFKLSVFPGPGAVAVAASPKSAFAAANVDEKELDSLFHDGKKHQINRNPFTHVGIYQLSLSTANYNAVSLINPDETAQSLVLDVGLRKGVRLCGRLLDPGGQPLTGVRAIGLTASDTGEFTEGPTFEISGMSPKDVRRVVFVHEERKLGKFLVVHAEDSGPVEARLEPCGVITGRLVDRNGRPVPHQPLTFSIEGFSGRDARLSTSFPDGTGHFEQLLVPQTKYVLHSAIWLAGRAKYLNNITLKPGQTMDSGDVSFEHIGRPPPK